MKATTFFFLYLRKGSVQTPEIYRHQLAHARFLHGHTIDHIHRGHGLLVVRYNDELRVVRKFADHVGELGHIRIIQWCVHFVEDTERRRLDKINGKKQCRSRQRLLSP